MTTTEDPLTSAVTMTPEVRDALMAPFSEQEIGKLPRVTCKKCSDPRKFGDCDQHRKQKCTECDSWVSTQHIHIDYVGHADVTHRLLSVDPGWTWAPLAWAEDDTPALDRDERGNPVGMWMKLTVAGVTRLGYGSVPSGQSDAVKVLIGDALRNSARMFGVAWQLWAKGDRADPSAENATASAGQAEPAKARNGNQRNGQARNGSAPATSEVDEKKASLRAIAGENGWDLQRVADVFATQYGVSLRDATNADDVRAFTAALAADPDHVLGTAAAQETNGKEAAK